MLKPDPEACCPDSYYCTTADTTLCPRHHQGPPCCTGDGHHTTVNRQAWHLAHDILEERLLHRVFLTTRAADHQVTPAGTLGGALDTVLGVTLDVVPASTLDTTLTPVG